MKISKRAKQKDFILDIGHYTSIDLDNMVEKKIITYLYESYMVYASQCKEIKVICLDGYYETVVILESGLMLFIEL